MTITKGLASPSQQEFQVKSLVNREEKLITVRSVDAPRRRENVDIRDHAPTMPISGSTKKALLACPPNVLNVLMECLRIRREQHSARSTLLKLRRNKTQQQKTRRHERANGKARASPSNEILKSNPEATDSVPSTQSFSNTCLRLFTVAARYINRALTGRLTKCLNGDPDSAAVQLLSQRSDIDPQLSTSDAYDLLQHVQELVHWAEGGFHHVWRVKFNPFSCNSPHADLFPYDMPEDVVIRVRKNDLVTEQTPAWVCQEVSIRKFITNNLDVPVPRIYAWDDGEQFGFPYTVEEFVPGTPLNRAWSNLDEQQKDLVLKNLAHVLLNLADADFSHIGAMYPDAHGIAPHVEQCMDGERVKVYDNGQWDIGPYSSTRDYVLSMYDKEISYYEGGHSTTFWDEEYEREYGSPAAFIRYLRRKRDELAQDGSELDRSLDRFMISHGDLSGRNILVDGTEVLALIDFEFAAILPVSQFFRRTNQTVSPLELYGEPETLPDGAGEQDVDEWWQAKDRAFWDNATAMRQLRRFMITEAERRDWDKSTIDHLLRGWASREESKVQWQMGPDLEPEYDHADYEDVESSSSDEGSLSIGCEESAEGEESVEDEESAEDEELVEDDESLEDKTREDNKDQSDNVGAGNISSSLHIPDFETTDRETSTMPAVVNEDAAQESARQSSPTLEDEKQRQTKRKENKRKKEARKRKKALAVEKMSPQNYPTPSVSFHGHNKSRFAVLEIHVRT